MKAFTDRLVLRLSLLTVSILCVSALAETPATPTPSPAAPAVKPPDRASYLEGKKAWPSEDGFAIFYLPPAFQIQKKHVPSRTSLDINNNMRFQAAYDYFTLVAPDKTYMTVSTWGDLRIVSGDPKALVATIVKDMIAEKIVEKKDKNSEAQFKFIGQSRNTQVDEFTMDMEGNLKSSYDAIKRMKQRAEFYVINKQLLIGITYVQRLAFKDGTVCWTFSRWVCALVEGRGMVVAETEIKSWDKTLTWETALPRMEPLLCGLLPNMPPENKEVAQKIVGQWHGESYTPMTAPAGGTAGSFSSERTITFSADGRFVWKGSYYVDSGRDDKGQGVLASGDRNAKQGTYKVFGKRLILQLSNKTVETWPIDHPEPGYLKIGGYEYTRQKK